MFGRTYGHGHPSVRSAVPRERPLSSAGAAARLSLLSYLAAFPDTIRDHRRSVEIKQEFSPDEMSRQTRLKRRAATHILGMVCFQRHSKPKIYKVQKSKARSKGFCVCCGKLPVIKCRGSWLCSKFIAEEPGLGEPVMEKAPHTAASTLRSKRQLCSAPGQDLLLPSAESRTGGCCCMCGTSGNLQC
ncbi:uncharacterized protein LOC143694363 [Agelaius phoeniceus]|uniref:uncharacterized protein LOC143694363 n=1 Tax=Agelaius phoeniceus TaxID=39638 RepID=UPI004054D90A